MLTQKRGLIIHPDPRSLNLVAWKILSIGHLREHFFKSSKFHGKELTERVFEARFRVNRSWTSEQSVSPHSAPVGELANFLIYLH